MKSTTSRRQGPRSVIGQCVVVVALLGAVSLVACGGATAGPTPTPSPTPPLGPPTAHFSLVGDSALTGSFAPNSGITCSLPSLQGMSIAVFSNTSDHAVGAFITMRQGFVNLRLGSGSGTAYTQRDFTGTGVTGFSAARGAQITSTLSETTVGSAKGTIGALTSVSGAVDCGNQRPGSGSISVAGDTADGMLNGALGPIHVTCSSSAASGPRAIIIGLTHVGPSATLLEVGAGAGTPQLFVSEQLSSASHFYISRIAGAAVFSSGHVTLHGTAVESVASGATPHTLTVTGNATCGT